MIGIQERMDYIEKKVDQLIKQFPDHGEFTSNKEHLATSLEDYLKKVYLLDMCIAIIYNRILK